METISGIVTMIFASWAIMCIVMGIKAKAFARGVTNVANNFASYQIPINPNAPHGESVSLGKALLIGFIRGLAKSQK